jgi:tetratricopeptide (TPR) repeat protein
MAALAAAGLYLRFRGLPTLTDKDTVVLADFTNKTGDPIFDDTLKQALAVALQQSPFLSIMPDQKVREALQMMGHDSGERLTAEAGQELCERTGSKAVLNGSISSVGSEYVISLDAVHCVDGEIMTRELAQAVGKERVIDALGTAATKLRKRLGESLATVQKFNAPLATATTPSLAALKAYSRGLDTSNSGNDQDAVPFFQHAISLDPNFAMAYAKLGSSYDNLGEGGLAAENERKAYELRERTSERERLYIESHYYQLASGDLEKARQTDAIWAETYPRDGVPRNELGANYTNLGQYESALGELREALRLDPSSGESYANLVVSYIYLNRLGDARATINEAQTKNLDSASLHQLAYVLAFLQNDTVGMSQQIAWGTGKSGVEDVLFALEADTAAYSGRLEMARRFSNQAVTSAERANKIETAAGYEAGAAIREALFGNAPEARQWAAAAAKRSTNREVQFGAALALAFIGDNGRAQKLLKNLSDRFPEDTIVQFSYLPTLRCQLALVHNDPRKAIESLQGTAPYELGIPSGGAFTPALYPVYVRGVAFIAAKKGTESAGEFQKLLAHRGVVSNEPIGASALIGLARAYAVQGDFARARVAYQNFLALWKNADPNTLILHRAKTEYATLK